jgi:peptidoglycan/LPS O-acetylase OafA/YrhL
MITTANQQPQPADYSPKNKELHIPSLDGLRTVAAMLVFVAHAGLGKIIPGGLGVTIFFFLSGFLITTLLRVEYQAHGTISLSKFYLRRAYRILPPMYITLLVAGLIPPHFEPSPTVGAVVAQALHLTNYYVIFFPPDNVVPGTGVMWSLAIEEHFYLLYPLALIGLLRLRSTTLRISLLLGVCALVLIWRCVLIYVIRYGHDYTYLATDARLDQLLYGCILGLWLNPAIDSVTRLSSRQWACIVSAAFGLMVFSLVYRDPGFRETIRYSLQGVALFPIFFCAVRFHHWAIFRWLQFSWIRGFGLLTYSFYLFHERGFQVAALFSGNMVVRACIAFVVTLTFSASMYFLVERRMGRLRRRLHG